MLIELSTVALSLVRPLEYRTDVRLLIIQKQSSGYDPYLSMKAADRIAQTFAEVIFTNSFIQRVQASEFAIPSGFFAVDEIQAKKQWKHRVTVKTGLSSGILEIQTYHEDQGLSFKLASAIADVIVKQGSEYHGGGDDIIVKIVDAPVATPKPARPDLLLNLGVGAAVGFLISTLFLFLSVQDEDSLELRRSLGGQGRGNLSFQNTWPIVNSGLVASHGHVKQNEFQQGNAVAKQPSQGNDLQDKMRKDAYTTPLLPIEE